MGRWNKAKAAEDEPQVKDTAPVPIEAPLSEDRPGVIRVVSIKGYVLIASQGKDELRVRIPVNHRIPEIGSEIKIKTSGTRLVLA